MTDRTVKLHEEFKAHFGKRTVLGGHRLQDHALFNDSALIELLDQHPREDLYAFNMGNDNTLLEENRQAVHDGLSGAELLQAVRHGRLWLNVTRIDRAHIRYRRLINDLYAELSSLISGFTPQSCQGTLLISSREALVYYHADGPASALWHIRGRKRIWVYPALDTRYMKREWLEDIFAGVRHEYLPYEPAYDAGALVYDLEPGQWIAWPQNAPHRVTNLDGLNVSLSTEHFTRSSVRRFQLYVANRFFRTRLGLINPSTREDGAMAWSKIMTQRIARKIGLDSPPLRQYNPQLRVTPDAPDGVVALHASPDARGVHA